jgi:ADP-ribose diphosphatase
MRWERLLTEVAYRCRIFVVRKDQSRQVSTGNAHDFYVIDAPDWVTVIPLTTDQRVVMVQQFRHGIRDLTLEVPAGIIDPDDPSPAAAARRELREETGYVCREVAPLGVVHPNPALMSNRCHVFVARDAELEGAPQWDHTEELEVETIPLAEVPRRIRRGEVTNALTVAAFHLLEVNGPAK